MTAVCVQPGTELAFEKPVRTDREPLIARALRSLLRRPTPTHHTAIFRQITLREHTTMRWSFLMARSRC